MSNAFSNFWAPFATGLGFAPDLFSSLILIIVTIMIAYFLGRAIDKKELFFPITIFMLLLWGIIGYLDLLFIVPPILLGILIYWKTGAK